MAQSYQLHSFEFEDSASRNTDVSDVSYSKPGMSTPSLSTTARKPHMFSKIRGYKPVDNTTEELPKRPTRPKSRRTTFLRWWMPEIIASFLSIISLLSIVIVLIVYEGKGIDDLNLPNWLTLNGLVATLSTFNRVCLMIPVSSALSQEAWLWFSKAAQDPKVSSRLRDLERSDRASRGVWGSMVLLGVPSKRYLAHFGAIITILSLAVGTFNQQLISYSQYPTNTPSLQPGNLPRAEVWNDFEGNPAEGSCFPSLDFKAAVYNGMMTENIAPITANCPTGNCTWPATPSLAVCGECSESSYKRSCNETNCMYTAPSGSVAVFYNTTGNVDEGTGFQVIPGKGAKYNSSLYDKLYVANFDVMGAPYDSYSGEFDQDNITSQECAMWMCIHQLYVDTTDGHQTQHILQTFDTMNSTQLGGSGEDNHTFPTLPANMSASPDKEVYNISLLATDALQSFLGPLFEGSVYLNLESNTPTSDAVQAVWNGTDDMNAWMQNLALSMNNVIRSKTPMSRGAYDGSTTDLGVRIRWPWIALPIGMVAGSLILLIAVIVETARSPVEAWKGSPLAYLVFGVDQETRGNLENNAVADGYRDLGSTVGMTRAVLHPQPGGKWTFKAA
ncbi:hypothetical protein PV11_05858 [Exophiala sideris]|uniref:Uncharacterized protein n=1 Tax=Exophiala sideris TaxID=1016849 RepID=A0A0D1YR46_9EURO|nr:hypothetical protein PV11_05858 [Exophiala sideris]